MSLADWIGGKMDPVVELLTLAQFASVRFEAVQRLDSVRLRVYPLVMAASPRESEVRVGTM